MIRELGFTLKDIIQAYHESNWDILSEYARELRKFFASPTASAEDINLVLGTMARNGFLCCSVLKLRLSRRLRTRAVGSICRNIGPRTF